MAFLPVCARQNGRGRVRCLPAGIRESIENDGMEDWGGVTSLSGNFLGGAATCCGNETMTINRNMPTVLQ